MDITIIGIDLVRLVFQDHAVNVRGKSDGQPIDPRHS